MTRRGVPRCADCGRPIQWVLTVATRAAMPLDRLPDLRGNVTLRPTGRGELLAVQVPTGPGLATVTRLDARRRPTPCPGA